MLFLAYVGIVIGILGIVFAVFELKVDKFEAGEYVVVLVAVTVMILAGIYVIASHVYSV